MAKLKHHQIPEKGIREIFTLGREGPTWGSQFILPLPIRDVRFPQGAPAPHLQGVLQVHRLLHPGPLKRLGHDSNPQRA